MLDKMSHKKKFFTVTGFTLLLAVFAFYRSILPTFTTISECNKKEMELDSTKASSGELQSVKAELEQLNALVGSETQSIEEINRGLVDFIGENAAGGLRLTGFPPVHDYIQNQFTIYTHQAEVEGNFASILELVYTMEKDFSSAKVCAVKFHSKEDFKTKRKHLYGTIYVQNIRRNF